MNHKFAIDLFATVFRFDIDVRLFLFLDTFIWIKSFLISIHICEYIMISFMIGIK